MLSLIVKFKSCEILFFANTVRFCGVFFCGVGGFFFFLIVAKTSSTFLVNNTDKNKLGFFSFGFEIIDRFFYERITLRGWPADL